MAPFVFPERWLRGNTHSLCLERESRLQPLPLWSRGPMLVGMEWRGSKKEPELRVEENAKI
jgi:hypothetical protein